MTSPGVAVDPGTRVFTPGGAWSVRTASESDRRATDAVLTDAGLAVLRAATPEHAALVRRMFFDGLGPAALPALRAALEVVHEQVLAMGTLPRPGQCQRRLAGLQSDG